MSGPKRAINYAFDFENRLSNATTYDVLPNGRRNFDSTLDFTYDGLGRRMERGVIDNGTRKTADFLYDGLGYDMLAQYVEPGAPRTTYYYRDLSQILSRHEIQGQGAGLQYFYHYDGSGDVSAWTNQSGRSVQEYTYAPYGRLIDNNGPDNSSNRTDPHNSVTWSGKMWDKETELNYFGARDYDFGAGVWLTRDPYRGQINDPMSLHRYAYVNNNPATLRDAYGLSSTQIPGALFDEPKVAGSSATLRSSNSTARTVRRACISHGTSHNPMQKTMTGGSYSGCGDTARWIVDQIRDYHLIRLLGSNFLLDPRWRGFNFLLGSAKLFSDVYTTNYWAERYNKLSKAEQRREEFEEWAGKGALIHTGDNFYMDTSGMGNILFGYYMAALGYSEGVEDWVANEAQERNAQTPGRSEDFDDDLTQRRIGRELWEQGGA